MKISMLNQLLSRWPEAMEVVFAPIYHSEYTTEFHMVDGNWEHEGRRLLYHNAIPIDSLPEYERHLINANGYVDDSHTATYEISIAMYQREDGVLVIMS